MRFFKLILLFLLFYSGMNSYSQEETKISVYLDEDMNTIDISHYYKKCNSFLYSCRKTTKDSLVINSMYEHYKFGKLDSIENTQIRYLLARDTHKKNINTSTLIINFRDTIFGYEIIKKRLDSTAIVHGHNHKMTKLIYKSNRKAFDKNQKKCLKKLKKIPITPIYFYKHNYGYTYSNENFKWKQISLPIRSHFFKAQHSSMLILKSNGSYLYYNYISENYIKKLLEEDWTSYINDYNIAKNNLLKERNGFFKDMISSQKKTRTFVMSNPTRSSSGYKNYNQKLPSSVPKDAIRVKNRSEMQRYLTNEYQCFSYGSY